MHGAEAINTMSAVLADLWPGSSPVVVDRRQAGGWAGSPVFLPIPNSRAPRLLVPADSRRAAARAMLRFSTALTAREAAQRVAVGAALRAGGDRVLADRVVVRDASEPDSLRAHLGAQLGTPVTFSLGVGTLRVNRKPVLQLFDRAGRTAGFAKLGHSPVSIADVTAEAQALERLAAVPLRLIERPVPLWAGDWNGIFALAMSAVHPSPLQRPSLRNVPPVEAMTELARAFGTHPHRGLADTAWHQRLTHDVDTVVDPVVRARFQAAVDRAIERAAEHTWELGAWHGDWTPWNMARRRDGVVQLWDWERLEVDVPIGLDAVHFVVNERVRQHGATTAVIHAALESVGTVRATGEQGNALAGVYLATITGRYLRGSHLPGGEVITDRAIDFLEALEKWLQ